MSIQEHLNKIRNAIYGREVRESIAKGIETAYNDASEKDNANMEVKIARGTHPNLRSRLEEVDNKQQRTTAQLAQTELNKIDKNGVGQVNWGNIDQDTREIMLGEKPMPVVGVNSVMGDPNIVSKSVKPHHLTTMENNGNLIDINSLTSNHVLSASGGTAPNTSYSVTDYMYVQPGTYEFTRTRNYGVFNLDREVVEFNPDDLVDGGTLTINNPSYIRLSLSNTTKNNAMFVKGSLPSEYQAYTTEFTEETKFLNKNIGEPIKSEHLEVINNDRLGIIPGDNLKILRNLNLFDKDSVQRDSVLHQNGGVYSGTQYTSGRSVSDYMIVKPHTEYELTRVRSIALYNDNRDIIRFIDGHESPINTEEAYFMRITIDSEERLDTTQVSEKELTPFYEPYNTFVLSDDVRLSNLGTGGDLAKPLGGKKSIHFGDSLTGNGMLVNKISELTGLDALNVAVGGTRFRHLPDKANGYQYMNFLDLLNAKATGDWTTVDEGLVSLGESNPVYDRIQLFKEIDMNDFDYLTFQYGTNDISTNTLAIGDENSLINTEVNGALNLALDIIYTNWPNLKVYIISPIMRWWDFGTETEYNSDDWVAENTNVTMQDMINAMAERAETHKTPFKNLYTEVGINDLNKHYYMEDGAHPNDRGENLLAEAISKFLMSK